MKSIFLSLVLCYSLQLRAQNLPQLLKDITPGPQNSDITDLTAVGDIVFFIAPDGSNSFQLWRTDGTPAGTYVVKVINPTSPSGMYSYFTSMMNVGGTLFFLPMMECME
jgi:ELWxxDGT repeat protein